MDVHNIKELTRELDARVKGVRGSINALIDSHFDHVTRNCLQPILGYTEMYECGDVKFTGKVRDMYFENASVLGKYLTLLERFPEFKKDELKTVRGHFPDEFDRSNLEYVTCAWNRLLNQK